MIRYQQIGAPLDHAHAKLRTEQLRKWLRQNGYQGLLISHDDAFLGEYIQKCDERLCWATGFSGSAGLAFISPEGGSLVTDGRYLLQAKQEVSPSGLDVVPLEDRAMVLEELTRDAVIVAWPDQFDHDSWVFWGEHIDRAGGQLLALNEHPVDLLWEDRPLRKRSQPTAHPIAYAGFEAAEKLTSIRAMMDEKNLAALFVGDCCAVAWLCNIRGRDIPHTPIIQASMLIMQDMVCIQMEGAERIGALQALLGDGFKVGDDSVDQQLLTMHAGTIGFDPRHTNARMAQKFSCFEKQEPMPCPLNRMKMIKNDAEIMGMREAHLRDGVAMVKFLAGLEQDPAQDELSLVAKLETARDLDDDLFDISFDTICGIDAHGAIIHYRVSEASNIPLCSEGSLVLIDSGGQYSFGTTDITRCLWIGPHEPSQAIIDDHTLVLKAHIALGQAKFPAGTNGIQLDAITRAPLWLEGRDFAHGTGHGVGAALSVHEGPCGIHKRAQQPLQEGMVLSNEPGLYVENSHGIRIENLVLVAKDEQGLCFETLTLCPIDLRLIDPKKLTSQEVGWLNAYHQLVFDRLAPHLNTHEQAWLKQACRAV